MSAPAIIFYILSVWILVTGLLSVTTGKIFRAAISLLFCLMGIAGLYFWMELNFIAAIQIVVYAGGIVVLIIFSIFLTQQSGKKMPMPPVTRQIAALLAVLFGFALTYSLIYKNGFQAGGKPFDADIARIGTQMLNTGNNGYALPFETASILLLAAMIGCIVIAMKAKPNE